MNRVDLVIYFFFKVSEQFTEKNGWINKRKKYKVFNYSCQIHLNTEQGVWGKGKTGAGTRAGCYAFRAIMTHLAWFTNFFWADYCVC